MTPEQEEIQKRQVNLEGAEAELASIEAMYVEHRMALKSFEQEYLKVVDPFYQKIAYWEALITHQVFRIQSIADIQDGIAPCPDDPYEWGHQRSKASQEVEEITEPEFIPPPEQPNLKSLYRELAKRYHPDLAENPIIREKRAEVMQEINAAYQIGDLNKLIQISHRPEINDPERETAGDLLVRLIRRQAEVQRLVKESREKLAQSEQSPLSELMRHCLSGEEHDFEGVCSALKEQLSKKHEEWAEYRVQESQLWVELL
jgi:hypothetical protein